MCVCVCVCVCANEKERETETETERHTDRQTGSWTVLVHVRGHVLVSAYQLLELQCVGGAGRAQWLEPAS